MDDANSERKKQISLIRVLFFPRSFPKSEVVCSSRVPPPVLQLDREDEESKDGYQGGYLGEVGDECLQVS